MGSFLKVTCSFQEINYLISSYFCSCNILVKVLIVNDRGYHSSGIWQCTCLLLISFISNKRNVFCCRNDIFVLICASSSVLDRWGVGSYCTLIYIGSTLTLDPYRYANSQRIYSKNIWIQLLSTMFESFTLLFMYGITIPKIPGLSALK